MICLSCGHYSNPDGEMEREQRSGGCACRCHPWNRWSYRLDVTATHGGKATIETIAPPTREPRA